MKKFLIAKALSISLIVLGIIIVFTPYVLVPVCHGLVELKSGMMAFMRCHYTAQVAILIGALIIVSGLLLVFKKEETFTGGLLASFLGLALFLVPQSWMIGVCPAVGMACSATKTVLMIEGAVAFLVGLVIVLNRAHKERI